MGSALANVCELSWNNIGDAGGRRGGSSKPNIAMQVTSCMTWHAYDPLRAVFLATIWNNIWELIREHGHNPPDDGTFD